MQLEITYEKKMLSLMAKTLKQQRVILRKNAIDLAERIAILQSKQELSPSKYGKQLARNKQLLQVIEKNFQEVEKQLLLITDNGIIDTWKVSEQKNAKLTAKYLTGIKVPLSIRREYIKPNFGALKAFLSRDVAGSKLSDRLHLLTETTKQLYTEYLETGITQGRSADSIARELLKINQDPYNVSVFDKEGERVKLSKVSKVLNNKTGRGIYKSPLKNLKRVTRTEINAAYHTADNERYQKLDFIVGYTVHLSASHPAFDMCDPLAGDYPKSFIYTGWHPQCICYVTPILATKDEFREFLKTGKMESSRTVTKLNEEVNNPLYEKYHWREQNNLKN